MPLPLPSWMTPALAAASVLTGTGALAAPAVAAGTQPIDAALEVSCVDRFGASTATQHGTVTFKATVPATTSPGELVHVTDPAATLRLDGGPDSGAPATPFRIQFDTVAIAAPGSDLTGSGTSSDIWVFWSSSFAAVTPNADGGFGPVSLPTPGFAAPVRTSGAAPVVLQFRSLTFNYQLEPGGPMQWRICRPLPELPQLAVIPSDTTAPPPPSISSVSPSNGPLRGGNTVTLKGAGFSTPGIPIVTFSANASRGTEVRVIDDETMTFTMPFSYSDGPVRIEVELANRTTPTWPVPQNADYEYVGALPEPTVTAMTPTSGRAGDVLTLTGKDVDFLTSIRFGANADPVDTVIVSPSEINVTVPAGPVGPATVSLSPFGPVGGGSFAAGLGTFTYLAPLPPLPTITRVAPTSVRAGYPALAFITGTRLSNVRTIQIGGKRVPPLIVTRSSTLLFVAPALPAGTYPVRLVTKDGRLTPADPTRAIVYR